MEEIHKQRKILIFSLPEPDYAKTMKKAWNKFGLDWTDAAHCLTGEAFLHKHAPTFSCEECKHFTYTGSQRALNSLKKFYKFKQDLAEHMQKEHTEIWDKWITS